jgi:hypothetical protein
VKYAFSKPLWGTQGQKPLKSNGNLLLNKFFWTNKDVAAL